jgi:hypothetical protein
VDIGGQERLPKPSVRRVAAGPDAVQHDGRGVAACGCAQSAAQERLQGARGGPRAVCAGQLAAQGAGQAQPAQGPFAWAQQQAEKVLDEPDALSDEKLAQTLSKLAAEVNDEVYRPQRGPRFADRPLPLWLARRPSRAPERAAHRCRGGGPGDRSLSAGPGQFAGGSSRTCRSRTRTWDAAAA